LKLPPFIGLKMLYEMGFYYEINSKEKKLLSHCTE
jgi:hypothetical protein